MTKAWVFDGADYPLDMSAPSYDPVLAADVLEQHLQRWERAEALGFEGVFLSEHHFAPLMLSPSPNLLVAALAGRTRRIRLGVMSQVLPLYPAWRVAEECGMLDLLSRGRLEIGVARGIGFVDTDRLGMPREEVKERFEEALDILVKGLTEPSISYHGKHNRFDNLSIIPRPLQQPRPPIWQSVRTAQSAISAARRGFKVCGAFDPVDEIADLFEAYRHARPEATREDFAIRRHIFVADTAAEAETFYRRSIQEEARRYAGSPLAAELLTGVDSIWGDPDQVAEDIHRQMTASGAGHILMMVTANYSRPLMERSMDLFGEAVIPRLRALAAASAREEALTA